MESKNNENTEAPKQSTSWWKLLLSLAFGIFLVWFAFQGCDLEQIKANLKNLDYPFLGLVFLFGLTAHLIRAIRWIWLLKPVADRNISLWNSFYGVIIGYAVNVVIPRGGEVARLVAISKMEKLPWAAVLPTMFIDRILDLVALVVLIGISLTMLPQSVIDANSWLVPGGIAMLVVSVVALGLLPKTHSIISWFTRIDAVDKMLPEQIKEKLGELSKQFDKGTKSLLDPVAYPIIGGFTALMWFCYGLAFYFMLFAFHIQDKVGVKNTLITLTIGSAGNLVPTPGSVGSFHVLVKETLVMTSQIDMNLALAYATVLHIMSYIVSTCVPAAFCVAINAFRSSSKATENKA